MEITISLMDATKLLLLIALIVLVVFVCVVMGHAIRAPKNANRMLEDFTEVSKVVSQRTNDVDMLIDRAARAMSDSDGVTRTVSSVASTISTVKGMFPSRKGDVKEAKETKAQNDKTE